MKDDKQLHQWKDCDPGSISNFVEQRRISRWQSIIGKISSSVIAGAAVVTLCTVFLLSSGTSSKLPSSTGTPHRCRVNVAPISCENAELLLPSYAKGKLCYGPIVERLDKHLENCESCREMHREMQNSLRSSVEQTSKRSLR